MNNRTTNPSISTAALTAGYCLLIMTILAILIFPSLRVSVSSIIGISVIILLDLIIAVSLYFLLKPVNRTFQQSWLHLELFMPRFL